MSQDLYRFDIANNRVAAVYEFDDGVWKRKTLDANETATVDAQGKVTLTENKGSYQEVKVYAPTGQANSYALQTKTYTDASNRPLGQGSFQDNSTGTRLQKGSDHDDRFDSSDSDDTIVGGNGIDTVVMKTGRYDYQLSKTATGTTFTSSTQGTHHLEGVERVHFTDTSLALDVDGTAGKAFRLYQAAFDRKPDLAGLGYWISQLDKDANLTKAAAGFVNSQEFKTKYGSNASIDTLVTKLYQNVLHRDPEQAGKDYWVKELSEGRKTMDQALADFSESHENVANLVGVMQNGVEYIPYAG